MLDISLGLGAGGARAFDPSSVSGLHLRLDPARRTVLSGSNVVSWDNDSAAEAMSFTNADPNRYPLFVASGLNGHPSIRFNGSNQFLTAGDKLNSLTGNKTLFVVSKFVTLSGYRVIFSKSNAGYGILLGAASSDNKMEYTGTPPGGVASIKSDVYTPTSWHVLEVVNRTAQGKIDFYVDGADARTNVNYGTGGADTLQGDSVILGARGAGTTDNSNIEFAELLLFNRALSSDERTVIRSYLGNKFGLTVQ